jgi:hypothetical protein
MNNSKDINVLLKSLKSLIEDQEVGLVSPAELSNVDGFEQIYTSLLEIRSAFIAMGTGELAYLIRSKGYFPAQRRQSTLRDDVCQEHCSARGPSYYQCNSRHYHTQTSRRRNPLSKLSRPTDRDI